MVVPNLTVTINPASGSKISFKSGHNAIKLTYSSDISLMYSEVRITKGTTGYDIGVGYKAYELAGSIASNTQHVANIAVNSTSFSQGDGVYTISLYCKNAIDGAWSEYHLFIDVNDLDFIPADADGLIVVTAQDIPA